MSVLQYPGALGPSNINTSSKRVFAVSTAFPQRKPRVRYLNSNGSYRRDIKDNIHEAALINIVASVNIDSDLPATHRKVRVSSGRGSSKDSCDSSFMNFAHLIFPRNKAVSIPKPTQRVFNMPEETIQRKPVYYKHTLDKEVRKEPDITLGTCSDDHIRIKVPHMEDKRKNNVENIIKNLPVKPQIMDNSFLYKKSKKNKESASRKSSSTTYSRQSSSHSGVRPLGSLKRPIKFRELKDVARCEAVDLLESEEQDDTTIKHSPSGKQTPIPYIRTKSLPVLFPTKHAKPPCKSDTAQHPSNEKPHHVFKDRPLSESLRRQTPISMYLAIMNEPNGSSFGSMSINNGLNQPKEVMAPIIHDIYSARQPHPRVPAGIYHMNRYKLRNPLTQSIGIGRATIHSHPPPTKPTNELDGRKSPHRSKTELHKEVQRVMSGRSSVRIEIGRDNEQDACKKSCISSKSRISDVSSGARTPKKVQFTTTPSDLTSEAESERIQSRQGGVSVIETPTNECKMYAQNMRPMSAKELLRIQQKILPANIPCVERHQSLQELDPVFTIHGLQQPSVSTVSSASIDSDGTEKELDLGKSEDDDENESPFGSKRETPHENMDDFPYKTKELDVDGQTIPIVIENDDISDEELGVEDGGDVDMDDIEARIKEGKVALANSKDELEFYKIFKAVDLNTYESFEHKKIRRTSASTKGSDGKKAHYVKVKLS